LGGTLIYERLVRIGMQYIDSQRLYVHAMHDPTLWGSLLTFKKIFSQRWRILSSIYINVVYTPRVRTNLWRSRGINFSMSSLLRVDAGYSAAVRASDFSNALDVRLRNTAQSIATEQHGRLSTVSTAVSYRLESVSELIYVYVYLR
jgi:hypothetical protein